jgi:hypothetical protein
VGHTGGRSLWLADITSPPEAAPTGPLDDLDQELLALLLTPPYSFGA